MRNLISLSSRQTIFWLAVISLVSLTACQSAGVYHAYEGSPRPDNETATIIVPVELEILFIDKAKYTKQFGLNEAKIKTLPGPHQFIIGYKDFWEIPGDQHERVESKPISLTVDAQAGQIYRVAFRKPTNIDEARSFAEKPKIDVIDTKTQASVPAEIKYQLYTKSFFTSLFAASTPAVTTESTQSSSSGDAQQIGAEKKPILAAAPAAETSRQPPSSDTETKDQRALEMLKYWWKSADQQQQESFRQWLNK